MKFKSARFSAVCIYFSALSLYFLVQLASIFILTFYNLNQGFFQAENVLFHNEMYNASLGNWYYAYNREGKDAYLNAAGSGVIYTVLADHQSYIHPFLILPFYLWYPDAPALQVAYAIYTVLLSGVLLWLILVHMRVSGATLVFVILLFFVNPFTIPYTGYGIYLTRGFPEVLAYPFGILFTLGLLTKNRLLIFVSTSIVILIKEQMFILPLVSSLYIFKCVSRKDGITIACMSIGLFLFNSQILPGIYGGDYHADQLLDESIQLFWPRMKLWLKPGNVVKWTFVLWASAIIGIMVSRDADQRRKHLSIPLTIVYGLFVGGFFFRGHLQGYHGAIPLALILCLLALYAKDLNEKFRSSRLFRTVVVLELAVLVMANCYWYGRVAIEFVEGRKDRVTVAELWEIHKQIPRDVVVSGLVFKDKEGIFAARKGFAVFPDKVGVADYAILPNATAELLGEDDWWMSALSSYFDRPLDERLDKNAKAPSIVDVVRYFAVALSVSPQWSISFKTRHFDVWKRVDGALKAAGGG